MLLTKLFGGLDSQLIGEDVDITGISYDSRKIRIGDIFVAIRGFKMDGHDFVGEAIKNGAHAVVVEEYLEQYADVTQIVVNDSRVALGRLSATFFDHPARSLRVIGVTGTNGKTTTTYFVKSILEHAGYRVGLVGTIQNLIGQEVLPATRTTPESLDLQRLLATMRQQGVEYVVMEVSSHALELGRTVGLEYDLALFTNLTQDHLDFHPSFEDYFNAKARLFADLTKEATKPNKCAIINWDDHYGPRMASRSAAPVLSYGVDSCTQIRAEDVEITNKGVSYRLVSPFGQCQLVLNLTGRFNVYNSLAAAAACLHEGIPLSVVKEGLESIPGVAGRFELVDAGQRFAVIVDYAHTPDSLENVLKTARGFAQARVITVFGAGGDRDKKKRPLMGKVAGKLSDIVIITSDNPRSEDPDVICGQIEEGVKEQLIEKSEFHYEVIVNRREAIRKAVELAKENDIVIIAGKGHETYQEFRDKVIHFDDRQEALMAIRELMNKC